MKVSDDLRTKADELVSSISARLAASSVEKLGHLLSPVGEWSSSAIARALMEERERAGGASATYFCGLLVIVHPDMPPHVWDGVTMRPISSDPEAFKELSAVVAKPDYRI